MVRFGVYKMQNVHVCTRSIERKIYLYTMVTSANVKISLWSNIGKDIAHRAFLATLLAL